MRHYRYLRVIPNETISVYAKGQNKPEEVKKPLPRSVDMVEMVIKVITAAVQQLNGVLRLLCCSHVADMSSLLNYVCSV